LETDQHKKTSGNASSFYFTAGRAGDKMGERAKLQHEKRSAGGKKLKVDNC